MSPPLQDIDQKCYHYAMNYEDLTVNTFSQNAHVYQSDLGYDFQAREKTRFMLSLPKKGKILDLGCGPGHDSLFFKNRGFEVMAVDGAPGMISLVKQKGIKALILKYSDLHELEEEFDGIWASYALIHIPKKDLFEILKKIKKLLKSDGVFYASFQDGAGEEVRINRDRYSGIRYFAYYNGSEIYNHFKKVFPKTAIGHLDSSDERGVYAWVVNENSTLYTE